MALERTYTIPLRKEWLKAPKYRRAKRAINAVKTFLARHMKSEDVRLGPALNEEVWKHGIKNPPGRIRVNVLKDDEGLVRAELFGAPMTLPKAPEAEKEKKAPVKEEKAEKVTGKKEEKKAPVKKKTETKKKEVKEEKPAEPVKEEKKASEEKKLPEPPQHPVMSE